MNQIELHPYLQQKGMRDFAKKEGILVTAFAPLGAPGFRGSQENGADYEQLLKHSKLQPIADKHKKTIAQVMLRWSMQLGNVVIPKSVKPERIEQNFDVLDFELSDEDMKTIEALNKNLRFFDFGFSGMALME